MIPDTGFPADENGCWLFAAYEAANAKEQATAIKLLYSRHRLAHSEYMKLLSELRSLRAECNGTMLAIATHRRKMTGICGVHGGHVDMSKTTCDRPAFGRCTGNSMAYVSNSFKAAHHRK